MKEENWVPIGAAAKDGSNHLVRKGSLLMNAFWTGSMWAYACPRDESGTPIGPIMQTDEDPTEYAKRGENSNV